MNKSAIKYKDKLCYGYREIEEIIYEEKQLEKLENGNLIKYTKKWEYFELSNFKWVTYTNYLNNIDNYLVLNNN